MKTAFLRKMCVAGLTLVEILVGVAVLGILLAVAAPSMADLMDKRRVIAVAGEISGILAYTKAETNSTNALLVIHLEPDSNMSCASVVTLGGGTDECQCYRSPVDICTGGTAKLLRLFQVPKSDGVKFVASADSWSGPVEYTVQFVREQLTTSAGNLRVDVTGRKAKLRVEVNVAGRVRTCSPDGDISGYAKCA